MKGFTLVFCLWLASLSGVCQGESFEVSKLDAYLQYMVEEFPDTSVNIYVALTDQVDVLVLEQNFRKFEIPLETRAYEVITQLRQKANQTQGDLLQWLNSSSGVEPFSIQPLWIANIIFANVDADIIKTLSNRPDVSWLGYNAPVEVDTYDDISPEGTNRYSSIGGHEPGLAVIHAPAMWQLGYTGYGQAALSIDTGVDSLHPSLAHKYKGRFVPSDQAWFDFNTGTTSPFVCTNANGIFNDHGTHTTGIMVGLDPQTQDTIGVAPEGLWMGAPAICDALSSDNLAAFQWALDPDGDPGTIDDMPAVINNSWRTVDVGFACKNLAYTQALTALEAAGIAVVFSAGNSGPSASSITPPKNINIDLVNSFSVGSVNGNAPSFPINTFSSRGPSACPGQGSLAIKPEVAAPGFAVRSSVLNGGYGSKSGTSMAAPHASGAILLLKEAFPYLSGTDLKLALYQNCQDLGPTGEDNSYGMGLIDVFAAYNFLLGEGHLPVIPSRENNVTIVSVEEVPRINCSSQLSPVIEWKNSGENDIHTVTIAYEFDNGVTGSILWTGNLPEDSSVTTILPIFTFNPGNYHLKVEILHPNGMDDYRYLDNEKKLVFTIPGPPPTTWDDTACLNKNALLTAISPASGSVIHWYDDSLNGNQVGQGNAFQTPPLDSSQTYYASVEWINSVGESKYNLNTGDYTTPPGEYLRFNCSYPFRLASVMVSSQSDGYRTVELKDASGMIIDSRVVYLNIGESRIELDFDINPGNNYLLSLNTTGSLFSTNSGASYPYEVPGVVAITGSSLGQNRYVYFYDWEIVYANICGRTPATAFIGAGNADADFEMSTTQLSLPDSATIDFTDVSSNGVSWYWDFGDGNMSTVQHPTHTYDSAGTFIVSLSVESLEGCSDAVQDTLVVKEPELTTRIENFIMKNYSFELYPNPSGDGIFYFQSNISTISDTHINVYDQLGKEVFGQKLPKGLLGKGEIHLGTLDSGTYFMTIISENHFISKRIQIIH